MPNPRGNLVLRLARSCWIAVALALVAVSLAGCGSTETTRSEDAAFAVADGCRTVATEGSTVPRLWVEANLDGIRRDFPAPTVHSRNLWYLSAVMWDAWALHTAGATPYFGGERVAVAEEDRVGAIREAITFAAYRLLSDRYASAVGAELSLAGFDELAHSLCLDPAVEPEAGTSGAVGVAIAERALEFGAIDGSLESAGYLDLSYQPVNAPLLVASDEIVMEDPNRWQPLQLSLRATQNGQDEGRGAQVFIGSNWGSVTSFALPAPDDRGVTIDPGPPPLLNSDTDDAFRRAAVAVIAYSDMIGGETGAEVIDISPGAIGNNVLGQSNGSGRVQNPVTGVPYETNLVPQSDYARAVAEFWADGPDSETPPGHWNTLAMRTSELLDAKDLRWRGQGLPLSRLEWDLRLLFTLNASLHDTAIAVWGAKRAYDYPRPISMIRYLGTDSEGGLPATPGLVEVVTDQTTAVGGRHQGLDVGATAVRTFLGPVMVPETQLVGVGWREAINWLPYQRDSFVSPAFAGYVSGHSGFSRAAADVLTAATGSEFFPGGLFTHDIALGSFIHEEGPSADMQLQWATYGDAADEAGESRLYGGIHVEVDDIAGRVMGAEIADLVWAYAQTYFPPQ